MSREFKMFWRPGDYYYLNDSKSREENRYLIYDMNRWDLLELWWNVFWAWLKG